MYIQKYKIDIQIYTINIQKYNIDKQNNIYKHTRNTKI